VKWVKNWKCHGRWWLQRVCGTIPLFAWSDWGKLQKFSFVIPSSGPGFEPETFQLGNMSFTPMTMTFICSIAHHALLGYYTASSGNSLPMFWDMLSVHLQGSRIQFLILEAGGWDS
jgi:hypothetical protein